MKTLKNYYPGQWFIDFEGNISVMKEKNTEMNYCTISDGHFEYSLSLNDIAYPLTLDNKRIADDMNDFRKKFHKNNISSPETLDMLNNFMCHLMQLSETDAPTESFQEIWREVDKYYEEQLSLNNKIEVLDSDDEDENIEDESGLINNSKDSIDLEEVKKVLIKLKNALGSMSNFKNFLKIMLLLKK